MRTFTSGVILLVLTSGCQGDSTVPMPEGQTHESVSARSAPLTLHLDVPAQARVGAPVQLKITLRNTSTQPTNIMLGGRPPFDFIVTTPEGVEVWRWSRDQVIQAILEMRTMEPGAAMEYDAEWPLTSNDGTPVAPGPYLVRGLLNTDPPEKLETPPKALVLAPR